MFQNNKDKLLLQHYNCCFLELLNSSGKNLFSCIFLQILDTLLVKLRAGELVELGNVELQQNLQNANELNTSKSENNEVVTFCLDKTHHKLDLFRLEWGGIRTRPRTAELLGL